MEPVSYSRVLLNKMDHKHRTFSTSTPFMSPSIKGSRDRQLSGCLFDSGLGSSISESLVQTSICTTPTSASKAAPKFPQSMADVTITHSPIFSKNRNEQAVDKDDTLDISNISFSKSRRLFRRKLNLDIDIQEEHSFQNCDEKKSEDRLELINMTLADNTQTPASTSGQTRTKFVTPSAASVIEQKIVDLDKLLLTYSPIETDRLIGRKMGLPHVDVMSELHSRNISCVSDILTYLEPEDLCSMCMVSTTWRSMCEGNSWANQRRLKYVKQCMRNRKDMHKENAVLGRPKAQRALTTVLQTLATMQPSVEPLNRPQPERCKTSSDEFMEAAKTLKNDERLHKCPRCRKPARVPPVQERGRCQNTECGYDYCIKCLGEFHGSKPCAAIASKKNKMDAIGTKKSKKNLRRL